MKIDLKKFDSIILFKESKNSSNSFDVSLNKIQFLKEFSEIDCTFFMYPYDLDLSADSFLISPYEEYVKDVSKGKRSMYRELENVGDNIFGISLGFAIFMFFWLFNRSEIFSIESVVSIFAAYTIGKEFWNDFDNGITNLTQKWKISWRDNSHYFIKQDFGSIQKFWKFARVKKYSNDTLLAYKIDFVSYSNSKTVEMFFRNDELQLIKGDSANLISINFHTDSKKDLKNNFMFGTKLTLTKSWILWKSNLELFQAVSNGEFGAVDKNDLWSEDSVLVRKTLNIGRLKFYRKSCYVKGKVIEV